MELIADRGRRVPVEELNTTRLLAHAKKQAQQRKFDDMLIVDVDAHHYENECMDDILPYIENEVIRQLALASRAKGRGSLVPNMAVGFQDMGGRITRYPLRSSEKVEKGGKMRDVQLGHRWMDAMSVDYSCLFPTLMLAIGLHPDSEMEVELCWAYNRWLTEKAIPESDGRFYSMLSLPLSEPDAAMRQIETFAGRKGVAGFMITSVRGQPVHHNRHMKVYRALEERGLPLSFHSAINPMEPVFKSLNRFAAVHGLGFPFYNILHVTNWVTNGIGERFPKLPVIWIEGGLAWVPFLMQRLDHEFMLRPSEFPLLKKKPSDYMRDMFYASQPMETVDMQALECTFRMINAETQLLYASDYPHWDFDLPSSIYDLPFLTEKAKHNILGCSSCRRATRSRKRISAASAISRPEHQ
jgi:predicted TIM-barrel fold metal-dependent hydrolase